MLTESQKEEMDLAALQTIEGNSQIVQAVEEANAEERAVAEFIPESEYEAP